MQHAVGLKYEWDEHYQRSLYQNATITYLTTMRSLAHFHLRGMTHG